MRKLCLSFVLLVAFVIASCLAPGSYIKFGNGEKIVPKEIAETWTFTGKLCLGYMTMNECPETVIHIHQKYYKNPDPKGEIKLMILTVNKKTGEIFCIEFFDRGIRYVFAKTCGRTTWKQYSPDPGKST